MRATPHGRAGHDPPAVEHPTASIMIISLIGSFTFSRLISCAFTTTVDEHMIVSILRVHEK